MKNMGPSRFFIAATLTVFSALPAELSAESLPDIRPAMIGSGSGSLVNLINTQTLFQQGQRDAWVMFECSVAGDGIVFGSDFFTASPDAKLLKNEIRRRLRQTRFIPAVYNHKRTSAWFAEARRCLSSQKDSRISGFMPIRISMKSNVGPISWRRS